MSYRAIHVGCHPILTKFPLSTYTLSSDFAFRFFSSQLSLFSHHFRKTQQNFHTRKLGEITVFFAVQFQESPKNVFFVIIIRIPKA